MKVKQVFGETRFVPWIGRDVTHGETIEVADDQLASYLEGGWEPADKATVAAQQQLLADRKITVGTLKKAKAQPDAGDGSAESNTEAKES